MIIMEEQNGQNFIRNLILNISKDLGIEKELFHRSIINALEIKDRFTILQYAKNESKLEEYADKLTNLFYGD